MGWYVMRTVPGKEMKAAELVQKKVNTRLWKYCRILKKQQLFRIHGQYELSSKEMFPGYLFISSEQPKALTEELQKSRDFPQVLGEQAAAIAKVEDMDLQFLRNACGQELEHEMWLSTVEVDGRGIVCEARGVLKAYMGCVIRQRLNKRFVIAEVPLFNRKEEVLFGIRVDGDPK